MNIQYVAVFIFTATHMKTVWGMEVKILLGLCKMTGFVRKSDYILVNKKLQGAARGKYIRHLFNLQYITYLSKW